MFGFLGFFGKGKDESVEELKSKLHKYQALSRKYWFKARGAQLTGHFSRAKGYQKVAKAAHEKAQRTQQKIAKAIAKEGREEVKEVSGLYDMGAMEYVLGRMDDTLGEEARK